MAAIEASEEEVAESIAGKEAELAIAAINGPDLDRDLRRRGRRSRSAPRRVGGPRAQDQTPRRLPRLPLAPDGADARGVRRGRREPSRYGEPQDPDRLQPHGRAARPRAGDRPRLLGAHTCASRCASPMPSRPSPSRAPPPIWSSAPTRCSARWRRSACGEEAQVAFVPTLREGRPEADAVSTALAQRPRVRRQARLGRLLRWQRRQARRRCPPTPSSASATGSTGT